MIKVNELRIGNWVEYEERYIQVTDLSYMHDIDENWEGWVMDGAGVEKYRDGEMLEPIPLTPEILEKAGFVEYGGYWDNDGLEICPGSQFKTEREGFWACAYWQPSESETETKLPYVHQLQNLYFALTGEELNIAF